ncbi:hypothetical protein [Anabaena subtropica]|uniref:Uncharacterized protein n=1 Tax=Anabaena subtropica FACHB-260 TaxID=2692884 RepID=A0ABR8CU62_9NOST|nr:hypothetical protein [Anabaena subtropica]MBD2346726.1 hypothetical protein [Anabaena subtropica FACHB-260]
MNLSHAKADIARGTRKVGAKVQNNHKKGLVRPSLYVYQAFTTPSLI